MRRKNVAPVSSGAPPGPIVRAAIHPAIGIARVGNSKTEFYFGPEVTDPLPKPPGFYKDGTGALKREATRFRVYGYDAAGNVVGELTWPIRHLMRVFAPNYKVYINQMGASFGALGVVEARKVPAGDVLRPPRVLVESKPGNIPPLPPAATPAAVKKLLAVSAVPATNTGAELEIPPEKTHRFHR